jgi:hypothetical protein
MTFIIREMRVSKSLRQGRRRFNLKTALDHRWTRMNTDKKELASAKAVTKR